VFIGSRFNHGEFRVRSRNPFFLVSVHRVDRD
jgi:hypothetical protein